MMSRVASLTNSSLPEAVDNFPSISAESSSRVRIDEGILFAMGCSSVCPAPTG
jgi:hypothetical protein